MTTSLTSPPTGSPVFTGAPVREDAAPARRAWRRFAFWSAVIVPLAGLIGAGSWAVVSWRRAAAEIGNVDRYTVVPRTFSVVLREKGELRAKKSTEITSEVQGRSTIIYLIPEGTAVQEGDLLVELASDEIEDRIRQEELKEANAVTAFEAAKAELEIQRDKNASDIRKAKLQIELRKLALEKYEKGDWTQKLKDAEIAIQQADMNLKRIQENYESAQKLYAQGYMTKTQFEDDKFSFYKAQWELEKADKAKEVLEAYTHVADLRQKQSDLEEAQKEFERVKKGAEAEELKKVRAVEGKKKELDLTRDQLAKLRHQKDKCRIVAPTQGFVVYFSGGGRHFMSSDSQIREGATVHERQILMSLPDTSEMLVVVRVHEAKTDKLHLGQPAQVRVEGLPDREFAGVVTKIAVVADTQNRWLNPDLKEYETEITLDPTDAPLKPGVTAHCEILVEKVEHQLAVPVQAVYSKTGRRFVFRVEHHEIVPQEVQLGAIGTEWAQITDGLSGGERILLAFADEQKRLIPDRPVPNAKGNARWGPSPRARQPAHRTHTGPGLKTEMKKQQATDTWGSSYRGGKRPPLSAGDRRKQARGSSHRASKRAAP